jgi:hypothetical protein
VKNYSADGQIYLYIITNFAEKVSWLWFTQPRWYSFRQFNVISFYLRHWQIIWTRIHSMSTKTFAPQFTCGIFNRQITIFMQWMKQKIFKYSRNLIIAILTQQSATVSLPMTLAIMWNGHRFIYSYFQTIWHLPKGMPYSNQWGHHW